MKLDRVDIHRLPGISEPFSVQGLSAGVNIVVGPNGCGKSSLCRAVRGTLWPSGNALDGVELDSVWTGPNGSLDAEVRSGVQWRSSADREPTDAPALPGDHLAHCYTLGLEDLLDATGQGDRALADRLRVHMAGGFDLDAAVLGLRTSRQHGKRESGELDQARRALQVLEGERRTLSRDADRLDDLREQLRAAESASEELSRLRQVREHAERQAELAGVQGRLAARPDRSGLAAVGGRELDEWDELARDIASLQEEIADAQDRMEAAEAESAACGLVSGPVDEAELRGWLERARVLADTERSLVEAVRAAAESRATRRAAGEALAGEGRGRDLSQLEAAALDAVDVWITDAIESAERRHAIEERLTVIAEGDIDDLDVLHRAAERLREWLSSAGAPAVLDRRELLAGAAALSAVAAGLAVFVHPGWWFAAGVASGGLAVASWLQRLGVVDRAKIEARYGELEVSPPEAWQTGLVRERLAQVEADIRHCERARERAAEREGLVAQLDALDVAEAKLRERRLEIGERLGVDPGARPLRLADWTTRLRSWRESVVEEQAGRRRCEMLRDEARRRTQDVRFFLAELGEPIAGEERLQPAREHGVEGSEALEEAPLLRSSLESLRDRGERWRRAQERAAAAGRDRVARSRHLRELEARSHALRRRVGIDPQDGGDPRAQLARLVDAWPAYRADCEREAQLQLRLEEIRAQLAGDAHLVDLGTAALDLKIARAESRAASRSEIAHEIGGIETRVRDASAGDARERAAAEVATAESALEASLDGLLLAEAGRFLLADVETEHEVQSRPEVLRRASEAFAAFTHHHFALEMRMGDDGARFRARETETGRPHELAQLSDGTRMQLLLAVRLAFATAAEAGPPLPLFLDEALTASDPQRFRAVAGSLLTLASEGRQIFYLTCDPADVALWQQVAEEEGVAAPHVVDLAACRRLAATFEPRAVDAPSPVPLPPANGSAADYAARLGVPAPDPWRGADGLHLFHALRGDLALLHRLLAQARIETVGHWRSLVKTGQWQAVLDASERQRVDALTDLVSGVVEAWRVGRGRPVDRRVLSGARIVSASQLERLISLADDLAGDARRLVDLLEDGGDPRVKGIRHDKRAALRAFFEERGHLVAETPLDATGIRIRAMANTDDALATGQLAREEAYARVDELIAQLAPR